MSTGSTYLFIFLLLVALGYGVYYFSGNETTMNITESKLDVGIKGLSITDVMEGKGAAAQKGDTVIVHYIGKLENGTEFDSSYNRGIPFSFVLGEGSVIEGWERGLEGMKVGGVRRLVIASDLAYGERGVGSIPANATLVFEISLLDVQHN